MKCDTAKAKCAIRMDNYASMFLPSEPLYNVLPELLKDQTTGKNIVWATDTYNEYGECYYKDRQMFPDFQLNLMYDGLMLPRTFYKNILTNKNIYDIIKADKESDTHETYKQRKIHCNT